MAEPIRVGAKYGAKRQRAIEATYPLSGSEVNESWSIDEYDLKLKAIYRGVEVSPKLLVVRERLSGLPLSHLVLHRSANGNDTGLVLAAAAIGYTVEHPYDDGELRVAGVARYLHADQGGAFIHKDGAAAARRLGIGLAPIPSHQSQANGDHEVMHQFFGRRLRDGMGSARGWLDRTDDHDKRKDHGTIPFETVVDTVADLFVEYIHSAYTSGDREGMTRLEAYARAINDGQVYTGHDLTAEDEAALAKVVGDRAYDATRDTTEAADASNGDTDAVEPIRPTHRGRRPADPRDGADEREAANEELAARTAAARRRLRAARNTSQTSTTSTTTNPNPNDNPDSEPGGDNNAY